LNISFILINYECVIAEPVRLGGCFSITGDFCKKAFDYYCGFPGKYGKKYEDF